MVQDGLTLADLLTSGPLDGPKLAVVMKMLRRPAPVEKADGDEEDPDEGEEDLDPLEDDDFVKMIARLTEELQQAAERQEALALRTMLDKLDVDWTSMTAAAAGALIEKVVAAYERSVANVIPRISPFFAEAAGVIIPETRRRVVARDELSIGSSLSTPDKETAKALLRNQGAYVRDEFGRRAEAASEQARKIVSAMLERGLGSEEISVKLAQDLTLRLLGRSKAYWEVIATAFLNKARTATQLNAYAEAGITVFRFVAVLDERTTDICRYMDGKTFKVSNALGRQQQAEGLTDTGEIKDVQPWVYRGRDAEGRDMMYFERGGRRHRVAYIEESAVGRQDERGRFTDGLTDAQLEAAGVTVPPLHPYCRSTIVTEG